MTHSSETFRQSAAYYRNAIELAQERRDEAITWANERVGEYQADSLAMNQIFEVPSFASENTLDGTYTIEALSQESQPLLTEDSNTTTDLHESENSSAELLLDHMSPVKHLKGPKRRRSIASGSDYDGYRQ